MIQRANIRHGIFRSSDIKIKSFNLDFDNIGRGMMNFMDNYNPKNIDPDFFQQNTEFLDSLTDREIITLSGYTHIGDRFSNILLRKTDELRAYIDTIWPKNSKNTPDSKKLIPIYYQLQDRLLAEGNASACHNG